MKTYKELTEVVNQLEPQIRESIVQAEAERNMPAEIVSVIRESGLFKMWAPEKLGGWQVDPVTACRIFDDLGRIYSAAGWLVQMSNGVAGLARPFGDQAVEEMFDGGNTIFATAFNPPGRLDPTAGGYRLSGRFPFSSACKHADWYMCIALEMDGDEPKMVDGHPSVLTVVLPMSDGEVVDNWDTLGMRGTGSHDVKVEDLFIPSHRTTPLVPVRNPGNRMWSDAMNNMSIWHVIASVGTVPLGVGRAAMDEFIALAKSKIPSYKADVINKHAVAHYRVGEARATLNAARANMYTTLERVWESAKNGQFITDEDKCDMQLAGTFAARAACDAIEIMAKSAGTSVVRQDTSINRHLRDLRTVTQHGFISSDRYEDAGALALEQTPTWPFMSF